jgi:hypothetical protein
MKASFYIITCLLLLKISSFKAQNPVYKEATLSHPAELWKPVALGTNGVNERDGIQFYSFDSECNGTSVVFVKLINTNPYAVLLSYQTSSSQPRVSVTIASQKSLEGKCSSTDPNIQNLTLTAFDNKSQQEKQEIQNYIFSHLTISKIQ